MAYLLVEIEEKLFLSKSKIKYIIKKMGIVPIKRGRQNQVYYSEYQVELIKENDFRNYTKNEGFVFLESRINYKNNI